MKRTLAGTIPLDTRFYFKLVSFIDFTLYITAKILYIYAIVKKIRH